MIRDADARHGHPQRGPLRPPPPQRYTRRRRCWPRAHPPRAAVCNGPLPLSAQAQTAGISSAVLPQRAARPQPRWDARYLPSGAWARVGAVVRYDPENNRGRAAVVVRDYRGARHPDSLLHRALRTQCHADISPAPPGLPSCPRATRGRESSHSDRRPGASSPSAPPVWPIILWVNKTALLHAALSRRLSVRRRITRRRVIRPPGPRWARWIVAGAERPRRSCSRPRNSPDQRHDHLGDSDRLRDPTTCDVLNRRPLHWTLCDGILRSPQPGRHATPRAPGRSDAGSRTGCRGRHSSPGPEPPPGSGWSGGRLPELVVSGLRPPARSLQPPASPAAAGLPNRRDLICRVSGAQQHGTPCAAGPGLPTGRGLLLSIGWRPCWGALAEPRTGQDSLESRPGRLHGSHLGSTGLEGTSYTS